MLYDQSNNKLNNLIDLGNVEIIGSKYSAHHTYAIIYHR